MLYYYSGQLSQALLDLFPEIGLLPLKLTPCMKRREGERRREKGRGREGGRGKRNVIINIAWGSAKNRRWFFENYAKEKGFDPLNPEHWYKQSRKHILSEKVLRGRENKKNNNK